MYGTEYWPTSASFSTGQLSTVEYNKQFEMIAPVKPTTLPACTRSLIRKGVECTKKDEKKKDDKKAVKPVKPVKTPELKF
jgi:hypothetical protein